MKPLKKKSYRDFSKGNWVSAQNVLAPENSSRLALNLDTDKELGSLVTRDGTTLVGSQLVSGKNICGLHNFRYSATDGLDKIFASVPDSSDGNNDIYDVIAGTKSLEDDTVNIKTRFLTYLDSCLRINGTDNPKAWNSSSWVTTGGTFDLSNMPNGAKYAVEFKDRVYVAGMSATPDRVDYSTIANSVARTVSWTDDGAGFIVFEQEDGGGGITGLSKVPGYVLVFKKRTLKRYDGASAYPEDMTNQGAPSQEAITTCQGMCFWVNENGAWVTSGGIPKKISSYTVDDIIKSSSMANLELVSAGEDGEHVFWSFPSVTIYGSTYSNVVLKYNILLNTWDIRQYSPLIKVFARYSDVNDNEMHTIIGDNDGNVQKLDYGDTDNTVAISYAHEPQDWDFGLRMHKKRINRMAVLTENVSKGTLMWRNTHNEGDWKVVGTISEEVQEFDGLNLTGNFFNFKIAETVKTGQAKILGFEFPDGGVVIYDNVK